MSSVTTKRHCTRETIGFALAAAILSLACRSNKASEPPIEATARALNTAPRISDFVLHAQNSIRLQTGGATILGGDVGARGSGSGPFLSGGVAIDLSTGVQSNANRAILADSV